jgi:hypothetical protein
MTIGTEMFLQDSLERAIRENPKYAYGVINARLQIVNGRITIEDLDEVVIPGTTKEKPKKSRSPKKNKE